LDEVVGEGVGEEVCADVLRAAKPKPNPNATPAHSFQPAIKLRRDVASVALSLMEESRKFFSSGCRLTRAGSGEPSYWVFCKAARCNNWIGFVSASARLSAGWGEKLSTNISAHAHVPIDNLHITTTLLRWEDRMSNPDQDRFNQPKARIAATQAKAPVN
jgi:hypothetical protein